MLPINYVFCFDGSTKEPFDHGYVLIKAEVLGQAAHAFHQHYGNHNYQKVCTEAQFKRIKGLNTVCAEPAECLAEWIVCGNPMGCYSLEPWDNNINVLFDGTPDKMEVRKMMEARHENF